MTAPEAGGTSSAESWDDHIDNWTEFCQELKGELPKFQTLRRRHLAAAKLRVLIAKLDDEFDRAIDQLGEQDMEGFIAGGGEDAWTGFLSTARRLGKKIPKEDGEDGKLTNATARVQHMERSKEMVSIFNRIVRSHDKQLKDAVVTLTKPQMDRIVRKNHEKFSGTHKQKDQDKNGSSGQAAPKTLDHAFVTPRVKSAAKSRQAVSLLNEIVSKKDLLLKNAIENMERKEKTLLTSKNNDFLKFETQRAKQRDEFRQAKKTRAVADHPHATMRVRQTARATTALEKLKETVQKRSKALATSVKRIPKSQRDSFVRKVNGVAKDKMICAENALSLPAPSKQKKKNLDTKRYARAEVMGLSRRVKADVQCAIDMKDKELEKLVATMDEEELRVLADFGPNGMEDINLWKRDRRKRSWRRLSAFGMVRNDPKLYRRWKQQRHQHMASQSAGREHESEVQGELLGTTCATDIARRQPWSTDLHYTHRCRAQRKQTTAKPEEEGHGVASTKVGHATQGIASSGRASRKCVHTAPSSRNPPGRATPSRPASAPLGPTHRFEERSRHRSEATRTPRLANLARVFYESSVASTASMPSEPSGKRRHADQASAIGCPAQATGAYAGQEHSEVGSGAETHEHGARDTLQETGAEDTFQGNQKNSDLGGAEKRMESVRLLWAVSQMSADAVTKKIMHGYSERQRAREPNRRPQPPASHCKATIAGRRKRENISAGRRFVG